MQIQNKTSPIIALIGATGKTGRSILKGALERGYTVKALVRATNKLEPNNKLSLIKGSISDLVAVKELTIGADLIISCFGTVKKPNYIVEKGIATIITAIQSQNSSPRFIHLSAVGLGDSKQQCKKSFLWSLVVKIIFPLVGKKVFADMERGENLILKAKNINSLIVRAAVLNNKAVVDYTVQSAEGKVGKIFISRAAVAEFMLDVIENTTYDASAISLFQKCKKNGI